MNASEVVRSRRAAMCREWARVGSSHRWWELRLRSRLRRARRQPERPTKDVAAIAGRVAAALLRQRGQAAHAAALAVMDQLLSVREPGRDPDSELSLTATDQDWLSVG